MTEAHAETLDLTAPYAGKRKDACVKAIACEKVSYVVKRNVISSVVCVVLLCNAKVVAFAKSTQSRLLLRWPCETSKSHALLLTPSGLLYVSKMSPRRILRCAMRKTAWLESATFVVSLLNMLSRPLAPTSHSEKSSYVFTNPSPLSKGSRPFTHAASGASMRCLREIPSVSATANKLRSRPNVTRKSMSLRFCSKWEVQLVLSVPPRVPRVMRPAPPTLPVA
mmetsp:Transcript_65112/g.181045  ORF Transcript_65112/g.181045 Transcript_65112/m.181045 type:complete len:223 (-) Transcript_65112:96-764(-)